MQISSPLFLFLFLPLTLPILPLCPPKYRKPAMALISIAFLVLANLQNPLAFAPIGAVLLLTCVLVCTPTEIFSRLRLILGIALPVSILLAARLLAEFFPEQYTYPFGLGLITLGAISICMDHYRADVLERETPLGVIGYLLFFPTVTLGPVLRYKQYLYLAEHTKTTLPGFCDGLLLYIKGFLKRLAVCTVLLSSLQSILSVMDYDALLPLPVLLLALLVSFLLLYFLVSGITDMSRGLMAIYGYTPPRGQGRFFGNVAPYRMLGALNCSLDAFLEDYLATPLKRLFPQKWGRMLAALLVCSCTILFYRTHPALLLVALPLLVCAVLLAQKPKYLRRPRARLLRAPLAAISHLALSLFALALLLEDPLSLFTLIVGAFRESEPFGLYRALMSFTYRNHLITLLAFLLIWAPLSRYLPRLVKKCSARVQDACRYTYAMILLALFVLALLLLLPQFPQFANLAYGKRPL